MHTIQDAVVVSQRIRASADTVYGFARRMENLSRWASGLAQGIAQRDGRWFAQSPMGEVEVVMAPPNTFGVLDHEVVLPQGTRVHNAFRVTPCGEDSLLTFVVLRLSGTDQASFDADIAHVRRDLAALQGLLERPASP